MINARTLYMRFQANEVRANAQYSGKSVYVAGQIASIATDDNGDPYLALETGESKHIARVVCRFPRSANASIAEIDEGHVVGVRGICEGKTRPSAGRPVVTLRDCELVKIHPAPKKSG